MASDTAVSYHEGCPYPDAMSIVENTRKIRQITPEVVLGVSGGFDSISEFESTFLSIREQLRHQSPLEVLRNEWNMLREYIFGIKSGNSFELMYRNMHLTQWSANTGYIGCDDRDIVSKLKKVTDIPEEELQEALEKILLDVSKRYPDHLAGIQLVRFTENGFEELKYEPTPISSQ